MEKQHHVKASHFLIQGYDDYIAARILLNKGYILQGATLAATAVEKYLKAILGALNAKVGWLHLDKLEKIKQAFNGTSYEAIFEHLDNTFLEILSNVYRFRYLDGISKPIQFGFFVNQFLCELDYTVNAIEGVLKIRNKGKRVSNLQRDIDDENPDLFENNFLAEKVEKTSFMNRPSIGFGIYFDPRTNSPIELRGELGEIGGPYSGTILTLTLDIPDPKA